MFDYLSFLALLIVIVVALSLLVFQFITGVPPMPSSSVEAANVVALVRLAGVADRAIIYDLGCGWGNLVISLAREFPNARITGIELSPVPTWVARFRTRDLPNVHIRRSNFFNCDLRDAHAVTCYLMVKPMPKVASFLDDMLKERTPVVSLAFRFRDRKVARLEEGVGLRGEAALYFWPARTTDTR